MDAANADAAKADNDRADNRQRAELETGRLRTVRHRPGWGWLVCGLIVIGGILCGWGADLAFWFVAQDWLGVRLSDWLPWWLSANITFAHLAASAFVLAAAYYWFRRRPSDTDPGA